MNHLNKFIGQRERKTKLFSTLLVAQKDVRKFTNQEAIEMLILSSYSAVKKTMDVNVSS